MVILFTVVLHRSSNLIVIYLKTSFSLFREKGRLETEKENLENHSSNQETELKKVKKDLQESREKLKKSDEVNGVHIHVHVLYCTGTSE